MFEDYAIEGEDLDWTKVTDPRERKRLQNIINGRKYRERRLAQEAEAAAAGGVMPPGGVMMGGQGGSSSRAVSVTGSVGGGGYPSGGMPGTPGY